MWRPVPWPLRGSPGMFPALPCSASPATWRVQARTCLDEDRRYPCLRLYENISMYLRNYYKFTN